MKGWIMVHQVKSMHDNGNGSSIRSIANELGISRNTVRKYLRMNEKEIAGYFENRERDKYLDKYKTYITHLYDKYPKLTAAKVMRKLKEKDPGLSLSYRSVRRYVERLKLEINKRQQRYYEPVLDMVPGCQCQVDPGELRNVIVSENPTPVFFVVFVLSCSRHLYVSASEKPINTDIFIKMHNEAFRYFDGVTEECVYDQTKLVVTSEEFREVKYNSDFYQYATLSGFEIRVCEGYDPQSKGKVEAGVKYVKNDFFYGEEFESFADLKEKLLYWVDQVANKREHGTTGLIPSEEFELNERAFMKPYLSPPIKHTEHKGQSRKVDKTSLISWKSNKYSVPSPYQSSVVLVNEENGDLKIHDIKSLNIIAHHTICCEKNQTIKNINHYRDYKISTSEREKEIVTLLGDITGSRICELLKSTSPKIYKDQLAGLKKILNITDLTEDLKCYLSELANKAHLTTSMIRDHIDAYQIKINRSYPKPSNKDDKKADLSAYANIPMLQEEPYANI